MTAAHTCRVERGIGLLLRAAAVALLVGILALMVAAVLNRFVPVTSLDWSDEIIELMLVWMVFTGSAEVWRINQHFAVEIMPALVHGTRLERSYQVLVVLAALTFIGIFTWKSYELCVRAIDVSPYFSLSRRWWYAAMPVNGALMFAFSLRQLWAVLTGRAG